MLYVPRTRSLRADLQRWFRAGAIKGYSACPYHPGYNLLRVGAVVRTSETTGRSGYTQTNSPFDFAGCIPKLQGT